MKSVIYARVSSKEQEREGYSIPAQLNKCRELADKEGYKVAKEFIDVESAKQPGRTNFNKMVEYIKDDSVDTIICHKVDRLCRNFKDYVTIDDLKVKPLFVEEEFADNAAGKLTFGLKVLLAKHYIDNLSDEVKKGLHQKLSQGEWPGKAPYGYRNASKGVVEVDPVAAGNVVYLYKTYATGQYGLRPLRKKFKEDGLVYTPKVSTPPKSQIEQILKNPFYYGLMRSKGRLYKGNHDPIISKELFDKVQGVFQAANKPRVTLHSFPYTGLMVCSNCGCAITAEIQKGRYIYYHCTGNRGECDFEYVRQEELERQFEQIIKGLHIKEEYYDLIIQTLKESHKDELEFHKQALGQLRSRQDALKQRIAKAYEDKLDGVIPEELWKEKTVKWQSEIDEIDIKLRAHSNANCAFIESGVKLIELAKKAYSLYLQRNSAERGKLLHILCSNLALKGCKVHYSYKKPFDTLVEGAKNEIWLRRTDSNRQPTG